MRDVLGAVVGVAIAVLTVMLFEWISHTAFPPPPDLDVKSSEALSAYIASAPIGAILLLLAGYIVATFDGTFIAIWIGRAKPFVFALVVGVLMLVATTTNLIMILHPLWFTISAVVGIVVAAWAAWLVAPALRRTPPKSE